MSRLVARLAALACGLALAAPLPAAPSLDLAGYADGSGAITILHKGETVDPYFVLQALLLAQQHGLDITAHAEPWARWLLARQKPDATFDRYCRSGPVWLACKPADADDSMLALWLSFLDGMPSALRREPAFRASQQAAGAALARLVDPSRGVYFVSPLYRHGLFMDNLEVWSYKPAHAAAQSAAHPNFTRSIQKLFRDEADRRYLVSTQPEQKSAPRAFYPDAVAQIFPLLVNFPLVTGSARQHYSGWMQLHRAEWLRQVQGDFAWGLVAIVALQQGDLAAARCWLRSTLAYRHSPHWTVTDEVVLQVLARRSIRPADAEQVCS